MTTRAERIDVILETGKKRTFASAVDWPGWCRSGPGEQAALQALLDYGPRYARAIWPARTGFKAPADMDALVVSERLEGSATTDFGAPGQVFPGDERPVPADELERYQRILQACWQAIDDAIKEAAGRVLRLGPRGGGRDLARIRQHVYEVDAAYLSSLGGKHQPGGIHDIDQALAQVRREMIAALAVAVRGEMPTRGPRGGLRWTPRYFVRRLAWHELDHAWEIEDRVE